MASLQTLLEVYRDYSKTVEALNLATLSRQEVENNLSLAKSQAESQKQDLKEEEIFSKNSYESKCEEIWENIERSLILSEEKVTYEVEYDRDMFTKVVDADFIMGNLRLMGKDYKVLSLEQGKYSPVPRDFLYTMYDSNLKKFKELLNQPKEEQFKIFKIQIRDYFKTLSKNEEKFNSYTQKMKSIEEQLKKLPQDTRFSRLFNKKGLQKRAELERELKKLKSEFRQIKIEHEFYTKNKAEIELAIAGDEVAVQKFIDLEIEKFKNFESLMELYKTAYSDYSKTDRRINETERKIDGAVRSLEEEVREKTKIENKSREVSKESEGKYESYRKACLSDPSILTELKAFDTSTLSEEEKMLISKLQEEVYDSVAKTLNS